MPAILARGFRPFFIAATAYAATAMLVWVAVFRFGANLPLATNPIHWHAHEMIYGYCMAVIAGFLLTAVQNWTQVPTWNGIKLTVLTITWLLPRLLMTVGGPKMLHLAWIADAAFMLLLAWAVCSPIIQVRQWRQLGIIAALGALFIGNMVFYYGCAKEAPMLATKSLHAGLYVVIGLILLVGGRVIPFFTSKRIEGPYTPRKSVGLSRVVAATFIAFVGCEMFIANPVAFQVVSGMLALLLVITLSGWYSHGIWKKPMLWVLHVAYAGIIFGFILKVFVGHASITPSLAMHALGVGGIGLITIGMIARVSLGHTGRDIDSPPVVIVPCFVLVALAAVIRVVLPILIPSQYALWILLAQICWILAFTTTLFALSPLLLAPRPDGKAG